MQLKKNRGLRTNQVEIARIWKARIKLKRLILGIKLR
jgi:hypothetical protein